MLSLIVIGGFLGAGKTSAVNHLLANPQGRKIAVIVNDIGAINIDDALIDNADENRIALTNGCICCSLQSDLFEAVKGIASEQPQIDCIVIEASGISDPRALVVSLKLLEEAGISHTDTLAYLVDADAFADLDFDDAEQVLEHAAACDLLVINKVDLASEAALQKLLAELDLVATDTHRLQTSFAQIPAQILFSPGIKHPTDLAAKSSTTERHGEHHGYSEMTLRQPRPVPRARFDDFVKRISGFAWRAKGFVSFAEVPGKVYLFNLVGRRASLAAYAPREGDIGSETRLVVIARTEKMPASLEI